MTLESKIGPFNSIRIYRSLLALFGCLTLLLFHVLILLKPDSATISIFEKIFGFYRYFTMQTNLFILWLTFSIYCGRDQIKLNKIMGKVKGAATLDCLVFA